MRSQLFIENTELDLYDDIDTSFTYAIDDIKDFGSRNTSFSKTIVVPGNSVNNKAFGHVFDLGSSNEYNSGAENVGYNFNPAVSARCVVLVDNIQIFKGVLRLTEIINTGGELEYECFVSGELGGFIFQLGNARLEDLDFSAYNQVYSYANIIASWNTIAGSGVYFPLIDYGNVSTGLYGTAKKDFQYTAFRPALYVREYMEKIIAGTDYTVASNFFNSGLLDRLGIGHNQKTLINSTSGVFNSARTSAITVISYSFSNTDPLRFSSFTGSLFSDNGVKSIFTYTGIPPLTVTLAFSLAGTYKADGNYITIAVQKNGITVDSAILANTSGVTVPFIKSFTDTLSLVTGDTFQIQFTVSDSTLDYSAIVSSATGVGTSSTPSQVPVLLGDTIAINNSIPKGIFQKDFFIWLIKMFNLYVYETPFDNNKIYIEPYVNFYPQIADNALNWSEKIDRSSPIRITPMSELNARFYNYKFKEDNDFYNEDYRKGFNEGYGDRIYDTTFEFSKDTDVAEIGFANSILYQNTGMDKTFPAIYKLSGTTESGMDHVIRLLQFKKMTSVSWDMMNGATVLGSPIVYGYGGHVDDPVTPTNDICFGAPRQLQFTPTGSYPTTNIFNAYHSAYLSEITDKDSKLVTCRIYLTSADIMNLDFSKFIFIDGVLFRLNKISNYNPIDIGTTEIQLLKVIDL